MKALFVGSGSKGNATVFISGDSSILIDAGITRKRINIALAPYGKTTKDLRAIFITHNHNDHIKELPRLYTSLDKVHTGKGTIDLEGYTHVEPGEGVDVDPFIVIPFSSHHDAPNPLNYIILCEGIKIGYVTDTGYVDDLALSLLSNCDYYVFESNYEPKMLEASSRPRWLKQRIRCNEGHLSNLQCGQYLKKLIGDRTKTIFLAHLSEECNDPEVAYASMAKHLSKIKGLNHEISIVCLKQWETVEADLLV